MYRLNVQVTAYGRQTVPYQGCGQVMWPIKILWLQSYHWNGWTWSRQILYTCRLYQFYQQDNISLTKGVWLWSRDFKILLFVVMQRVARVRQRQRQLSYFFWGTLCLKCGFWGGQNGGRGSAMFTPNELVFTFRVFYVCASFGENPSRNASVRVHADGHTDRGKLVL